MANTPKRLYVGQPSTTISTIYTVPTATKTTLTNVILCNTQSTEAKISVHIVPSGGTATVSNKIISSYAVRGSETEVLGLMLSLSAGDSIQVVQATSGAITTYFNGVERA